MLMIAGVHLLGLACVAALIIPALRERPDVEPSSSEPGSDDGWGNRPQHPSTPRDLPGGGIPLPGAEPARVRVREPGRLADRLPARERRPAREPRRRPAREPRHTPAREPFRSAPGSRRRS
jgi:hypothetical protein